MQTEGCSMVARTALYNGEHQPAARKVSQRCRVTMLLVGQKSIFVSFTNDVPSVTCCRTKVVAWLRAKVERSPAVDPLSLLEGF